ncbi:hypothetical protein OG754_40365 (plasmid) [Streptomyces decoyicus]|uniref:hypothetical protein n=1 Tax=Streptomyces decoyicus TaxID=249567 RepID=UPI002E30AA3E|nr:hypothetical protein [Streptomyces decoyicus]
MRQLDNWHPDGTPERPMAPTTITSSIVTDERGTDSSTALWPLVIFTLVLVVLVIAAGLVYITWRHPALAAPLGTAAACVTVIVTIALSLGRR